MQSKLTMYVASLVMLVVMSGCAGKNSFSEVAGEWIDPSNGYRCEITSDGNIILKSGRSPMTYTLKATGPNQFEYYVENSKTTVPVTLSDSVLDIGSHWKAMPFPWPAAGKYVWAEENETLTLNPDYTVNFDGLITKCKITGSTVSLIFSHEQIEKHDELEGMSIAFELQNNQIVVNYDGDVLVFEKANK